MVNKQKKPEKIRKIVYFFNGGYVTISGKKFHLSEIKSYFCLVIRLSLQLNNKYNGKL